MAAAAPPCRVTLPAFGALEDMVDEIHDVIVVGSGAAGCAAALAARRADPAASVVMLEALTSVGGTTAKSGGVMWLPDNVLLRRQLGDQPEDRARLLQLMAQLSFPGAYRADDPAGRLGLEAADYDRLVAFVDGSHAVSDALLADGVLPYMVAAPMREYFSHLPDNAHATGRSLQSGRPYFMMRSIEVLFAGLTAVLRGPLEGSLGRMVPALKTLNMAWASGARFAIGGLGQDLVAALHAGVRRAGVIVRTGQAVDALLVQPTSVNAASADNAGAPTSGQHGKHASARGVATPPPPPPPGEATESVVGVVVAAGQRRLGARRGVILATGGFAHDANLRAAHGIDADATCACAGATGTSVRLAETVGARLDLMGEAWWAQSLLEHALARRSAASSAAASGTVEQSAQATIFFMRGRSMLLVDADGRRAVNEKASYDVRARVHRTGPKRRLLLLVADSRAVDEDGSEALATLPANPADPAYIHAATVAELAAAARRRLAQVQTRWPTTAPPFEFAPEFDANLAATLTRFNEFAAAGRDLDFARGETPAEADWDGCETDVAAGINPTLRPLVGPYVGLLVCPSILDTKGGPAIDIFGRVLRARDGGAVPGLYAAGNAAASWSGSAYWQAGATIGLALVTGWRAGDHAARRSSEADPA